MSSERMVNFGAGPGVLPEPVLEEAQRNLLALPGAGMSVLEISHRSPAMDGIIESAVADIRKLAGLPDDYHVLFLQGGATQQFAMVPLNLLPPGGSADYVLTGVWAAKAFEEAQMFGAARVAGSTESEQYARIPEAAELDVSSRAAYLHVTSNNTICGTQWRDLPDAGQTPLVVDASSDIFSRPLPFERLGLVYAGAQKNLGPAGVTLVIVRDDLVRRARPRADVPTLLRYASFADQSSRPNTPPVFAIYLVALVVKWLLAAGGLEELARRNARKAAVVYAAIDRSGFYRGTAAPGQPVADERHVPAAGCRPGTALHRRGEGGGPGRSQGAPLGGRHPGVALQRPARDGRRRAGRVHGGVRTHPRVGAFRVRVWRFSTAIRHGSTGAGVRSWPMWRY